MKKITLLIPQVNFKILMVTMFPQIWLLKNLLTIVYLCVETEKFYSERYEVFDVIEELRLKSYHLKATRQRTRYSGKNVFNV